MKSIKRKLKSQKGFTLAEVLITVLILLMVSSVMAGGIPAAANAYTKAVDAANAQALLSTTVNALRSELSNAWDVSSSGNKIIYYSSDTGSQAKIYLKNGSIWVTDYFDRPTGSQRDHELLSDSAGFTISYTGATYDQGSCVVIISGLSVKKGSTVADMPHDLQIHVVNREVVSS